MNFETGYREYRFECNEYDENGAYTGSTTKVFRTDTDSWSGYDGPMWGFFEFLKGCGFVFDVEAMIGVMKDNEEFTGADDL
jgi:hypothetical protein